MGSVCRKHYTRPLWPRAKLVTRGGKTQVEWRDRRGRKRKAEAVPDGKSGWRVRIPTGVFYADYRDAAGVVRVVPTGCKTESGARAVLAGVPADSDGWPVDSEPVNWACERCGGIGWWEDFRGRRLCLACESKGFEQARRLAERARLATQRKTQKTQGQ